MSDYEDPQERAWLPPVSIAGRVELPSLEKTNPMPSTSPFHIQAAMLAVAGDAAGLRSLDVTLEAAGFSDTGQVRLFIAATLATLGR